MAAKENLIKAMQSAIKAGHTQYAKQNAEAMNELKLLNGNSLAMEVKAQVKGEEQWQDKGTLPKGFYRITPSESWEVGGQQTDADGLDRGDPKNNIKHLGALVAKLDGRDPFTSEPRA